MKATCFPFPFPFPPLSPKLPLLAIGATGHSSSSLSRSELESSSSFANTSSESEEFDESDKGRIERRWRGREECCLSEGRMKGLGFELEGGGFRGVDLDLIGRFRVNLACVLSALVKQEMRER